MKSINHKHKGFSLVELLVVMALMGIFLGMITAAVSQSSRYTRNVASRSEMNDELRTAGQMMADQITRAVYIYPPGSRITLNAAPSALVNTSLNSNVWTVGNANNPIIAFIQAPDQRTAASNCPNVLPISTTRCMSFVAYYPVMRSSLTGGAFANTYGPLDAANPNARMIMEYRKILPYGRLGYPVEDAVDIAKTNSGVNTGINTPNVIISSTSTTLQGVDPNMVVDYVGGNATTTTGFNFKSLVCLNRNGFYTNILGVAVKGTFKDSVGKEINDTILPDAIDTIQCNPTAVDPQDALSPVASLSQGVLELTGEYKDRGGTVVSVPTMSFPVAPRNLVSSVAYNVN